MLSRDERHRLREIEHWFEEHDPRLAEEIVRFGKSDRGVKPCHEAGVVLAGTGFMITVVGFLVAAPLLVLLGMSGLLGGLALFGWARTSDHGDDGE